MLTTPWFSNKKKGVKKYTPRYLTIQIDVFNIFDPTSTPSLLYLNPMEERINLSKYSHLFHCTGLPNLGVRSCSNVDIILRSFKTVFVIYSWSAVTTMFPPYHNYNFDHANVFRALGLWMWLLIGPLMLHLITGYLCNFSFLQVLGPPSKNDFSERGLCIAHLPTMLPFAS